MNQKSNEKIIYIIENMYTFWTYYEQLNYLTVKYVRKLNSMFKEINVANVFIGVVHFTF